MAEKVQCPNCLEPAEKSGNKITCVTCDAVFEIKRTGAANVVKLGEVEALKGRVSAIEALLAPEPEPTPADVEEPEETEEPILPE